MYIQFLDDRLNCFEALERLLQQHQNLVLQHQDSVIPSSGRVRRSTASMVLESDVAARVVAERSLVTACAVASSHDFAFAIVSSTPLIQVVRLDSPARAGRPRSEPTMPMKPAVRMLTSIRSLYFAQVSSIDARGTASQCSSRAHPFKPRWTSCDSPVSSVFSNFVIIVRSISIVLVAASILLDAASLRDCVVLSQRIPGHERAGQRCSGQGLVGRWAFFAPRRARCEVVRGVIMERPNSCVCAGGRRERAGVRVPLVRSPCFTLRLAVFPLVRARARACREKDNEKSSQTPPLEVYFFLE